MLEQRITLSLQLGLLTLSLAVVHMGGSVLGSLGLISDLFVVIGAIQAIKFFFNDDTRYEVTEAFSDFIDLSYIGSELATTVEKTIDKQDTDPRNIFESLTFVGPEVTEETEEELMY